MNLETMTDQKFLISTKDVVKKEKDCTHRVLLHLKEVEKRKLFSELNYQSIYDYCIQELGYTPGEANYRIQSMRLMKGSSKIEKALKTGALTLTNAVQAGNLFSQMKDQSVIKKEEIVAKIENKTKAQARQILEQEKVTPTAPEKSQKKPQRKAPAPKIKANARIIELLKEIVELDGGDELGQLEKSLKASVARLKKRKEANLKKATKTQKKTTRYIPVDVKDKVRHRAKGQCEYIGMNGVRCQCRHFLEFDHIKMYCHGGVNNVENIRLLCSSHNKRAAIIQLGSDFIEQSMSQ